jgi:glycosyltransferase involved in cell wall biosynthesis
MEDSKPLITTVIPTFRRPRLLRRAIKSVLAQTYPNFRLCVYDNASGDETPEIVAELAKADPRIRYHCHSENIGAFNNFVFGMRQVDTQFFSVLSDDDVLLPIFYKTALEGFERHQDAMFSATGTVVMNEHGYVLDCAIRRWKAGFYANPERLLTMLRNAPPPLGWTGVVYRKEVIDMVIGEGIPDVFEDHCFNLKIAALSPFVVTLDPGAILLMHNSCYTVQYYSELYMVPILEAFISFLCKDDRIEDNIREISKRILWNYIIKTSFFAGMIAIAKNNHLGTERAYSVLKEYSFIKYKANFLSLLLKLSKSIPFARYPLNLLYRARKKLIEYNHRDLQIKYKHLALFLRFD